MEDVKNAMDKLVCRLDRVKKIIEIVHKGYKTTIRFYDDGNVKVINYPDATT